MDGVFMLKFVKFLWSAVLVVVLFGIGILAGDKYTLRNDLIRLHVVAASDSREDQNIKLQVRDDILSYLQNHMPQVKNAREAKAYLSENLTQLQSVAEATLARLGSLDRAQVTLTREEFPLRHYDTFSLPAGIYDSLRIRIGEGKGQNWWCVVFPSLCLGATSQVFCEDAVQAGMDPGLAGSLSDTGQVQIRFFLLDCLGKLENFFHAE